MEKISKRIKLDDVTCNIDGMKLNDLSAWIKKQKEIYKEYNELFIEMEEGYRYDGQTVALILYGSKSNKDSDND